MMYRAGLGNLKAVIAPLIWRPNALASLPDRSRYLDVACDLHHSQLLNSCSFLLSKLDALIIDTKHVLKFADLFMQEMVIMMHMYCTCTHSCNNCVQI